MVRRRLADVEARLAELRQARQHLTELARRAETFDPDDCAGYCDILELRD